MLNHHAAQIDVRVSVDRPAFDSHINVVGFVNLLEGAGEGGVKRVIFASSGGVVYGDPAVIPTPETAPKLPISPYGVSKLAGEYYMRALAALRGFEGIAMRYANVFGPRQDPKSEAGVVSIFVSRLLAGQPLTVFGDGRQTRDYVFVKDVARANVLAGIRRRYPGTATSTRRPSTSPPRSSATCSSWPRRWVQVMGQKPKLEFADRGRASSSAARSTCRRPRRSWAGLPQYVFEDGLRELVDWFKKEAR